MNTDDLYLKKKFEKLDKYIKQLKELQKGGDQDEVLEYFDTNKKREELLKLLPGGKLSIKNIERYVKNQANTWKKSRSIFHKLHMWKKTAAKTAYNVDNAFGCLCRESINDLVRRNNHETKRKKKSCLIL